jgi:hypothetical protein
VTTTLDLLFLMELRRQCRFALLATQDLEDLPKPTDMTRFWYSIQAFLVAVGNISKILWPASKSSKYKGRGDQLRNLLAISSHSYLEPRIFRNHFEHFDERIESWFASTGARGFADSCIGPSNEFGGMSTPHYLRNYATDTKTIWFCGTKYDLAPVVEEINELVEKVCRKLDERHRWSGCPPKAARTTQLGVVRLSCLRVRGRNSCHTAQVAENKSRALPSSARIAAHVRPSTARLAPNHKQRAISPPPDLSPRTRVNVLSAERKSIFEPLDVPIAVGRLDCLRTVSHVRSVLS